VVEAMLPQQPTEAILPPNEGPCAYPYLCICSRDRIISKTLMMLITKTLMREMGCGRRNVWDFLFVSHYFLVWLQMCCNWSCYKLQVAIFYTITVVSAYVGFNSRTRFLHTESCLYSYEIWKTKCCCTFL